MTDAANAELPLALSQLRMAKNNRPRLEGVQQNKGVALQVNKEGDLSGTVVAGEEDADTTDHVDTSNTEQPDAATPNAENPIGEDEASIDYKKRYFDLKKHHDKTITPIRQELKEVKDALEALKKAPTTVETPKTDEELEAFKQKYPELYTNFEKLVISKVTEGDAELRKRLDEQDEARAKTKQEQAEAKLLKAHPDAVEVANSTEFDAWAEQQPNSVKKLVASYDIEDAIYVLDMYKDFVKKEAAKQKRKLDASRGVDTANTSAESDMPKDKKVWKESEIRSLIRKHPRGLPDAVMEEITKARREGRFIMDVQ